MTLGCRLSSRLRILGVYGLAGTFYPNPCADPGKIDGSTVEQISGRRFVEVPGRGVESLNFTFPVNHIFRFWVVGVLGLPWSSPLPLEPEKDAPKTLAFCCSLKPKHCSRIAQAAKSPVHLEETRSLTTVSVTGTRWGGERGFPGWAASVHPAISPGFVSSLQPGIGSLNA